MPNELQIKGVDEEQGGSSPKDGENGTQSTSIASDLQHCSWEELQEKFSTEMERHEQIDRDLQDQTARLLTMFVTWSQVTITRDEARSFRRFKTRMQHVQNSELDLEEKRRHYTNVVKAFESALALLK